MDSSYAPRSPDLSGYAPRSPDLKSYHPKSPDLGLATNAYAPRSPDLSGLQSFNGGPSQAQHDQPGRNYSLDNSQPQLPHWNRQHSYSSQQQISYAPFTSQPQQSYPPFTSQPPPPQQIQPYQDAFSYPPAQQPQPLHTPSYGSFSDTAMPAQTRHSNRTQQHSYTEPIDPPDYESYHTAPIPQQHQLPQHQHQNLEPDLPQQFSHSASAGFSSDPPTAPPPARRGRKPKVENGGTGAGASNIMPSGAKGASVTKKMDTGGVEVKTKFPTARIKRIMQADEDVGKVAQVTPVVVAKALELFMIRLVSSSASVAKSRGSKKVMAQHMKLAVMQDDQFDNLRDIVGRIPDAPTKGAKDEDGDDEEAGAGGGAAKGKGRGKGKKRRDSDEH